MLSSHAEQDVSKRTGDLSRDSLDRRAAGKKLVLQPLEAAVEMVDAVDHRLAFRRKPRNEERDGRPQIGRHPRRAGKLLDAVDRSGVAVEMDPGAEPRQFLHV